MPSDKCNSKMAKATGLISSLFNIAMCFFANRSSSSAHIMVIPKLNRLVLIELGQLSINQSQSHTELLQAITPFTIDYKHVQYTHAPYYNSIWLKLYCYFMFLQVKRFKQVNVTIHMFKYVPGNPIGPLRASTDTKKIYGRSLHL